MRQILFAMTLIGILVGTSIPALASASINNQTLDQMHRTLGKALDTAYFNAGAQLDLIRFDMAGLQRQGVNVPQQIINKLSTLDKSMRQRWLVLDQTRAKIYEKIIKTPPAAPNYIKISVGESKTTCWFGVHKAKLTSVNGVSVKLPLSRFKYGTLKHYDGERAAFIYSNRTSAMFQGFLIPEKAKGPFQLHIVGHDNWGGVPVLRIAINGVTIYHGKSPFRNRWSQHTFDVPNTVLKADQSQIKAKRKELAEQLQALESKVRIFSKWAQEKVKEASTSTAKLRKRFVLKPLHISPDFWKHHFVRGVDYLPFSNKPDRVEYMLRSFRAAGTNYLRSLAGYSNSKALWPDTLHWAQVTGLPYYQVLRAWKRVRAWPSRHHKNPYAQPYKFVKWASKVAVPQVKGDSSVRVNLEWDEPTIHDKHAAKRPAIVKAFGEYIHKRASLLKKAGVEVPAHPKPIIKLPNPDQQVMWMEWQLFKCHIFGNFFHEVWNGLRRHGITPVPLIQKWVRQRPQRASWVDVAKAIPMVSTDLYLNSSIAEGYLIQMLNHAMPKGTTIFCAGSGYSSRTPRRFRRSLATAMTHADGVVEWTGVYFQKYRIPEMYWNKRRIDNLGRRFLSNWNPKYWYIVKNMFSKMERADAYLGHSKSAAHVAVLFSQRTALVETSHNTGLRASLPYYKKGLGIYSDLIRRHIPVDACIVESTTANNQWDKYDLIILSGASTLRPEDLQALRTWVRSGGTLITSANTSLCDQWGRPQDDYKLAKLFGAHYRGTAKGQSKFTVAGQTIQYNDNRSYARVAVEDGRVIGKWPNGDPALIQNRVGKGTVYLFTAKDLGGRSGASAPGGLYGNGWSGLASLFTKMIHQACPQPMVTVQGAPDGVELAIQRKGDARIIHLLDWGPKRTIQNIKLKVNLPTTWEAFNPALDRKFGNVTQGDLITIAPFKVHTMVVLKPTKE